MNKNAFIKIVSGFLIIVGIGVMLTAKDATSASYDHTMPFSSISATPTSMAGYGILDGISSSGSYLNPSWITGLPWSKITGAPTIPAAQVQVDWNAPSGITHIANQPTLGTAALQNSSAFATAAQGTLAASALQSASLASYATTASLGSAAFSSSSSFATAAQGTLAGTALQSGALASYSTTASLGTSAFTASTAYATASQGGLAATAVQPAALSGYVTTPTTVNGHALSANVVVTPSDMAMDSTHRWLTDAFSATWNAKFTLPSCTVLQLIDGTGACQTIPIMPQTYVNGTLQANTKQMLFSGTLTSGAVTFYMTVGGTSGGTAICTSTPTVSSIGFNNSSNMYGSSYTITNSFKNLNITATQSAATGVISLLGLNLLSAPVTAPNGTPITATVNCN